MEMLWFLGVASLLLVLMARDWRRERWVQAARAYTRKTRPAPAPVLAVNEDADNGD